MPTSDAFDDHVSLVRATEASALGAIAAAASTIAASLAAGGTCFAFGNGGSAADAQHLVAELVGQFDGPRRPLAAVALTGDAATLTSIANDLGFTEVFARQITGLARPGDVAVAISTSGRSPNVVAGAAAARTAGCNVVGLTADGGHDLGPLCDVVIDVPSSDTQRIQEVHGLCIHVLVSGIEARLEGNVDG